MLVQCWWRNVCVRWRYNCGHVVTRVGPSTALLHPCTTLNNNAQHSTVLHTAHCTALNSVHCTALNSVHCTAHCTAVSTALNSARQSVRPLGGCPCRAGPASAGAVLSIRRYISGPGSCPPNWPGSRTDRTQRNPSKQDKISPWFG